LRLLPAWMLVVLATQAPASAFADSDSHPPEHETQVLNVHAGFVIEDVVPANIPTCLAFLPDGSFLVGEKLGRVYRVVNAIKQQPPLWNGETEVLSAVDNGLVGIAVDPNFTTNRYVYFLYVVDPDTNAVDGDAHGFGRLTRYQVDATGNTLVPGSRTILMGVDRSRGPLVGFGSHTVGALRWGTDGSLLVSVGDGATAGNVDAGGIDPGSFGPGKADPAEDIGAFRSQDMNSLNGKILRLDPANGQGRSDNPFWDGNPHSDRSKVWQYGLRNPFRFSVRPGTGSSTPGALHPGTLFIGDVGWTDWEEVSIATTPGMNFGWPCYEGPAGVASYQAANPAHHGCGTPGTPSNPALPSAPGMFWTREQPEASQPTGITGNCSIDGAFYTGSVYPSEFQGAYFFGDYGGSWLKVARFDAANRVVTLTDFATGVSGPADFARHPTTGDIHYVSASDGQVRRIRYTGPPNERPVAHASVQIAGGRAPFSANFSSNGTFDPDGVQLSYDWRFGDGGLSTLANPTHVYAGGGSYSAVLTVTDSVGWIDRDTVQVTVTGPAPFPATSIFDRFDRANGVLGGLWIGEASEAAILDSTIRQSASGVTTLTWGGPVPGIDQEAFARFEVVPTSGNVSVLLKAQGSTLTSGGIEVRYLRSTNQVSIIERPIGGGSNTHGTVNGVTFAAGDEFGARTYSDGTVQVFRNTTMLGQATLNPGGLRMLGGRVGLRFDSATTARLDDFGGGTLYEFDQNAEPEATVLSPAAIAFAALGDTVRLKGTAFDAEDPDSVLRFNWVVDLVHNNHVHPSFFTSEKREDFFIMTNHDDGTGVWYHVRLFVTDLGGAIDEVLHLVYPEIDLTPGPVTASPAPPGSGAPIQLQFWLSNAGGLGAPRTHWMMLMDGLKVAEGDTSVAAHDSSRITIQFGAGVAPGIRSVRIVADTLEDVTETIETNNARQQNLIVVPGTGPDNQPPGILSGPLAEPHGVFAEVHWTTNEPAFGLVRYGPTLAFGDSAVTPAGTTHQAILDGLSLGTRYYFRVVASDPSNNATTAPIDSFVTQTGTLDVNAGLPERFDLSPAMPNPTRGGSRFVVALPRAGPVSIAVYDAQGREIWAEPDREYDAGRWTIEWPGRSSSGRAVPAGLYLARVRAGGEAWIRRVAVIR
jgi:glucose/arabinose dehydrogenase/PKD repeat protein